MVSAELVEVFIFRWLEDIYSIFCTATQIRAQLEFASWLDDI